MSEKEKEKLEDFGAKIQQLQDKYSADKGNGDNSSQGVSGLAQGMRLATELLAGVAVGSGIGILLDKAFDTSPLFIIICMLFGTAAGILNVYRAASASDVKKK